jgi:hypothetical protein
MFTIVGTPESTERALMLLYSQLESEKERREYSPVITLDRSDQQESTRAAMLRRLLKSNLSTFFISSAFVIPSVFLNPNVLYTPLALTSAECR